MRGVAGAVAGCIALSACASIFEGQTQEIVVNTIPERADCALIRKGLTIGRVNPTPGAAAIKKTKDDITIACKKDGYQEATYPDHSGAAGTTIANVFNYGIGWAIDSASGADNKYDSPVNITLIPKLTAHAAAPAGGVVPAATSHVSSAPPATSKR